MAFSEIFQSGRKVLSLEFFPPKKASSLGNAQNQIRDLAGYDPDFMTVTYGAGGGTRDLTKQLAAFIQNDIQLPSVAHLTCVGNSVDDFNEVLDELYAAGIRHILALRGDPPKGEARFVPHPQGFSCARDLVSHIKNRLPDVSIAVAGYPETHAEALSPQAEIRYLKEKVDAGADLIVTQLFFETSFYFDFVARARQEGISVPIAPGVMPIGNVQQVRKFTTMCGASIPSSLSKSLTLLQDTPEEVTKFGIDYAVMMSEELLDGGAPGIHLYTLNKSVQAAPIIEALSGYFCKEPSVMLQNASSPNIL